MAAPWDNPFRGQYPRPYPYPYLNPLNHQTSATWAQTGPWNPIFPLPAPVPPQPMRFQVSSTSQVSSSSSRTDSRIHASPMPLPGPQAQLPSHSMGRPSLDRAHTFPTPPTSASSVMGNMGASDSFNWQGQGMNGVQGTDSASASWSTIDSGIDVRELGRDHVPEDIDYTPEITPSSGLYSCPYRKLNPSIFNVCDFPKCALGSFDSVSEVKQHVIKNHQSKDFPFECRVCTTRFRKRKDLDIHFNAQPCRKPLVVNNHQNGIDDVVLASLKQRRQGSRVETWEELWNAIFPGCNPMTPVFIPPRLFREKTDTSTQTFPEDPVQRTATSESRPSPSALPQQETPDSQSRPIGHSETTMPRTSRSLQQVGLARVHIEILSLSEQYRHGGHDETGSLDGFDSETDIETDSEGSSDDICSPEAQDSDGSHGNTSTGTVATGDDTAQGQESALEQTTGQKRNRTSEGGEEGNDNNRPSKRRRRQPRDVQPAIARFACPYQAYDRGRDCFKPSQRNPKGGCDSISRLKDHMTRKHMLSYRCIRCWKQFNSRSKAQTHPQGNCIERQIPSYEWFMDLEKETEVENCAGMYPVDTWWKLFQLLIPDMTAKDLTELMNNYSPYYVDTSFMIPSMHISNIPLENTPGYTSGPANGQVTTPAFLTPSLDAFGALNSTSPMSQGVSVPLFRTVAQQQSSFPSFDSPGVDSRQSAGSDVTAQSDRINMSSTPASSLNTAPSPALDTSQMQRNYERQKTRAEQAEAENGELRATISASREQLRDASMLMEGVLGRENLDREVCEQLNRAAEILLRVTGRLR